MSNIRIDDNPGLTLDADIAETRWLVDRMCLDEAVERLETARERAHALADYCTETITLINRCHMAEIDWPVEASGEE